MKGKKDLHFVCARCFAPDNGEEDADDILGAPTLTREDNVSEAEDMEEMEEPPVLELSVPMSENMASFHDNFSEDEEMEEPPVLELSVPIAESTVRSHVEEDVSADDSAEPMEEDSSFSQEPASIRIDYTITEPDVITERSIQDPTPSEETAEHELTYEVIPAGTQKGKDLLVDSLGYSYNVKDVRGITRRWLCSVRNRKVKCKASIIERNGYFRSNSSDHIHPPDPARELTAKVTSKELGLSTAYMHDEGTYCFVRKLLCLPFLPSNHIEPIFRAMCEFNTAQRLVPLLEYIDSTWMKSTVWPVECWSVFGQSVRTNNDIEGWHRRLNYRAGAAPPFYILIKVIHSEAREVNDQIRLVSELKLRRLQRKSYRSMQAKIFLAWERYRDGDLTTTGLLKHISTFYKPTVKRGDDL